MGHVPIVAQPAPDHGQSPAEYRTLFEESAFGCKWCDSGPRRRISAVAAKPPCPDQKGAGANKAWHLGCITGRSAVYEAAAALCRSGGGHAGLPTGYKARADPAFHRQTSGRRRCLISDLSSVPTPAYAPSSHGRLRFSSAAKSTQTGCRRFSSVSTSCSLPARLGAGNPVWCVLGCYQLFPWVRSAPGVPGGLRLCGREIVRSSAWRKSCSSLRPSARSFAICRLDNQTLRSRPSKLSCGGARLDSLVSSRTPSGTPMTRTATYSCSSISLRKSLRTPRRERDRLTRPMPSSTCCSMRAMRASRGYSSCSQCVRIFSATACAFWICPKRSTVRCT